MSKTTPTIRKTMVTDIDTFILETVPTPSPGPGEASVRTTLVGICGSDLHAVAGHHPWMSLPYAPGHEVVGIVNAVGAEVTEVEVGDRVTVEPTLPCWECKQCLMGRENICENLQFLGCGYVQGAIADSFTVPANRLHLLEDSMGDQDAVLIEPLATPIHAVRLAVGNDCSLAGRTVVIIGVGTIGQLVLTAAQHWGADRVVVVDPLEAKRDMALRRGAEAAFDPAHGDIVDTVREHFGESADFVFDCVSIGVTLDQGIRLADRAGTVVVVGVPAKDVTIQLKLVQDRQIRILGAATYVPEDYRTAVDIITSGAVRASELITAYFPFDRLAEAFHAAADAQTVKVAVHP